MNCVKLGSLYKVTSGGTPNRSNPEFYDNGCIPWIRTGDLKGKDLIEASVCITELGVENSSAKYFPKNTVLLAMYGATIGACSILRINATTNQACAAFCPIDGVLPEYLYYFFQSNKQNIINLGVGGAQPNISATILKQIEINVPDLKLQDKIVNILDIAQSLIDKRKQQIEACDELIKSLFYTMFGDARINPNKYAVIAFNDISNKITDGDHATPIRSVSGMKLLSARNVKNSHIDFNVEVDHVEKDEFERMIKRCNPEYGDILISCSGTIGRVSRVYIKEPFVLVRSVALIKLVTKKVNPVFIERYLQTPFLQAVMNRSANKSGQANLFTNQIKKIPIMLPPIELQNQFANQVEKIEHQKHLLQQSLTELENNFNSLMQRAFKGELF